MRTYSKSYYICAETTDAAEKLAWRSYLAKKQLAKDHEIEYDPLHSLKEDYGADEIMIITITDSFESRIRSYELIAKEISNGTRPPMR